MKSNKLKIVLIVFVLILLVILLSVSVLCFLYARIIEGFVIISAIVIFAVLFIGLRLFLLASDVRMLVASAGAVIVKADGILKINNNKGIDAVISLCNDGVLIEAEDIEYKVYYYDSITYLADDIHKYDISMNINDIGHCKFICNRLMKIKAMDNVLKKKIL